MEESEPEVTSSEEVENTPSPDSAETEKEKGFPEGGIPQQEEIDLNAMFPKEDQDLNELFPEKELKTLLHKVHKSQKDLSKMNNRFLDDTESVVPKAASDEDESDLRED